MTQLVTKFVVPGEEYETYLELVDALNESFGEHGWHWPHSAFDANDGRLPLLRRPLIRQDVVVKGYGIATPLGALRGFL